jgi:glycosyltransferase involved in cell wall biosynthesis
MIEQPEKKRICLVMRAPLARYPSSIFQAELLSEAGHDVWILDTEDGGYQATALPVSIKRIVLSRTDYSWRRKIPLLAPWRRRLFSVRLAGALSEIHPDLVVVYEPPAMAALGRLMKKRRLATKVVWHFHEQPEFWPGIGPGTRRDIEYARGHADEQDLVIFPDKHRAESFRNEVSLKSTPVVVMNCPRRVSDLPEPNLRRKLESVNERVSIVIYNGSIGPNRGVDLAIRSMNYWPQNAHLVLVGPCSDAYREEMINLSRDIGAERRLVFLGTIAPEEIWSIRRGADIALTMMVEGDNRRTLTFRFGAGASNKRFEAMTAGVAQITNKGAGIDEIVVDTGCGLAVDPGSPKELGRAVRYLLENRHIREEMGKNGRKVHLQKFNYETQFEPVMDRINALME